MKLTINANSWHYRLARYGLLDENWYQTDLCQYFWAMVRGVLRAPLLVVAGVFLGYFMVVLPVIAGIVWLFFGSFLGDFLVISFVLWGLAVAIVGIAGAEHLRYSEPGIIRSTYRGWKEKTCVLVEVCH
jgi:VIT1/CCC1 family predicted Fe2+/Mn2+ transporter